jgi:PAS domain S-box-containing protein
VLVLTSQGADSVAASEALENLGNVTLLERPIRVAALSSSVRTALRARARQYQIRAHLAEQERSQETRARLAAIVEFSDEAILSLTFDGSVTSWNAGAERLYGFTAAEMVGQSIDLLVPTDLRAEEHGIRERVRAGEGVQGHETVRRAKSGELVDVVMTVSPIRDHAGRIVGASKVARDIGARKRAEAGLREADRRKDEFLATLAHELRNPLAPIRYALHMLRRDDPTIEPVREIMERQVEHLVRLVDDLLEVSRITRGRVELRRERTELASVLRRATEISRPLLDASEQRLTLQLDGGALVLDADPVRLCQVFANLLNNASKYSERGGHVWLTGGREGSQAVISVRDAGLGIPADMLPSVFDLFVQGNRDQGGLGIGLTLVRSLVEMQGGTVTAHSAGTGQGSEFVVRLPLAPVRAEPQPLQDTRAPLELPRASVLIVDDNHDGADSLRLLLRSLGLEVRVAYGGAEALALLQSFVPELVLLDIGMPGMDGYEVARRIRADQRLREVVLVALTGWGQEQDRARARTAGFDHHLIKPADLETLQGLLGRFGAGQQSKA